MSSNAYLIGAFSDGKSAQRYFDSLAVLGDAVEPIIVQYLHKGVFDKVIVPVNVKLIQYKKEYPGNTGKHKDFREIVGPLLVENKWCIFTDMHDVVFQAPLPDLDRETEIYVASEATTFGKVNYWNEIFPPKVKDWEVYNVGCFVMKRDVIRVFWDILYENWMDFYSWYKSSSIPRIGNGDTFPFNIPFHEKVRVDMAIMFNSHYDTLCFNEFLRHYSYEEKKELFACYAYQVDMKVVVNNGGQLYRDGKLTTVAHFNGNTKKWMKGGE